MGNGVFHRAPPIQAEIGGSWESEPEEFFQPGVFGRFARLAYPHKTDAALATLGHVTTRAARAWMAGDAAPPSFVAAVVFTEVMRRCRQK